jgi:ABC-2 type transport system permease protein
MVDFGLFFDYSIFSYYGSAVKDGIDWTNFGGITACALVLVLLAVFAFQRRDIYT